jgi:hypothetical protein
LGKTNSTKHWAKQTQQNIGQNKLNKKPMTSYTWNPHLEIGACTYLPLSICALPAIYKMS